MIDYRETLKNLHEKFPHLTTDELIKILDTIVEGNSYYNWDRVYPQQPAPIQDPITHPQIWYNTVTC